MGVEKNYTEAVKWFRMGAQGGDAEAMYSLGFVYERGHGVPQDQMESRRWYQLAANLGHEKARSKI